METFEQSDAGCPMTLANRLRKLRDDKGLSLEDVAKKAGISKTYLWQLERDTDAEKKPSADVLLRIANALSTTLANLLSLPTVQAEDGPIELPASLQEFQKQMESSGRSLDAEDLRDLASMKFRGGQPKTANEWHQLYLLLDSSVRKHNES